MTRVKLAGLVAATALAAALLPVAPAQAAGPGLVVALGFDDGLATQTIAAQELKAHGMHGTFYINSARIGQKTRMTRAQIDRIAEDGNEIGGHTLTHVRLTSVGATQQHKQICQDRTALRDLGYNVRSFAYPFGAHSAEVGTVVALCGYQNARIIGGLGDSGPYSATLPIAHPYFIPTPGSVRSTTTLAEMKGWVEHAEAHGGLLTLAFHEVCDDCGLFATRQDTLDQFLSWLQERQSRGTVVRTIGETLDGPAPSLLHPLATPAPSPAPTPQPAAVERTAVQVPRHSGLTRLDGMLGLVASIGLLAGAAAVLRWRGRLRRGPLAG